MSTNRVLPTDVIAAVIDDLRFAVNYHETYGISRIANAARAAIEALETKERVNEALREEVQRLKGEDSQGDSLDGYHPMVRDFILGKGCFSQEAQIEAARRVGEKIGKAAAEAMNESLLEAFAPALDLAQTPGRKCDNPGDDSISSAGANARVAELEGERNKLRRQLPPTMQNCTIVFKECEFGHHWLTATNWAGHSCPWCEHDTLRAQLAKMKAALAASGDVEKKPMKVPSREWFERMASVDDSEMSVGGLASRVAELESAPAARDLYDIGHKIRPFVTLSSGPEGCRLDIKFKSLNDGQDFHGAMVRFFKSAPAANGAADSEISDGVLALEHMIYVFRDDQRPTVQSRLEKLRRLVEVLRDQAPAASGWLTEEELEMVQSWEQHYRQGSHYAQSPSHNWFVATEMGKRAKVCESILARSSPPEVVLPVCQFTPDSTHAMGWWEAIGKVKKALAAAGVTVKQSN